ncbi:hypothetical protein B1810_20720 [Panacagrimonas perspica]|uniref:hypothetical protein n=1 Tax=Panacagrimonas perspica TaxID=381431 RepID=UPI0010A027CC|nr:hypothetical protein [Panacagrimonas perspica]THD01311.1 hypothetical protein B1810_20720 [Panacagrimonas perspica]
MRAVTLSAAADAAADLSTAEKAAKYAVGVLGASNAAAASQPKSTAKAATACKDSGTQDVQNAGTTITTVYDKCVQTTNGVTLRNDGTIKIVSGVAGFPIPTALSADLTFGVNNVTYLTEVEQPGVAHTRSLLLGNLDFDTAISGGSLPQSAAGQGRLKGAVINLARQDKARADFELGNASTAYTFNITFDSTGKTSTIRFAGPFRAASPCGSGSGTISTPTPLTVNSNGDYVTGQIAIASTSGNATYTYSGGSVTVASGGGSQTYTLAQLKALCPAFN